MNITSRSPIYRDILLSVRCQDVADGYTLLLTHRKATRPTVKPQVWLGFDLLTFMIACLPPKNPVDMYPDDGPPWRTRIMYVTIQPMVGPCRQNSTTVHKP